MSSSIFNTVKTFKENFEDCRTNALMAQFKGKKDLFKKNVSTNKKIEDIYQKAQESINSWVDKPEGFFSGIKNTVRNLLLKAPAYNSEDFKKANLFLKPIMWLGKSIHNLGDKISPPKKKESADQPYEFDKLGKAEQARVEKKAKFINAAAKVSFVAGAILLAVGIMAPLALAAFLITLPESVALSVVIGSTALGIAGAVGVVAYPIMKNSKCVNEYEVKADKDYGQFIKEVVQKNDGGFNFRRKDIQSGEVLKIYKEWKESLEKELSKARLEKLEEERKALKKEFPG